MSVYVDKSWYDDEDVPIVRNGGKSAKQIRKEIGNLLTQAILEHVPILHVSHNDMDGYGCAMVMDVLPQYLKPGDLWYMEDSSACQAYNDKHINITHYHTGKLNDSMFDVLQPLAYGFAQGCTRAWSKSQFEYDNNVSLEYDDPYDRFYRTCNAKSKYRSNMPILLITDISGFDINRLAREYGDRFIIIVIDHHQWNHDLTTDTYYQVYNAEDHDSTYRSWDISGCSGGRVEIAATVQCASPHCINDEEENIEDIDMHLYICSDHSATKLLIDIMSENVHEAIKDLEPLANKSYGAAQCLKRAEKNFPIVQKVAEVVSLYDTGNFGNWYISDDDNDPQVSLPSALNHIVNDVLTYVNFNRYQQDYDYDTNRSLYLAFEWAFYTIKYQPEADIEVDIMELKSQYGADTKDNIDIWRYNRAEVMAQDFIQISKDYDVWKSTIVPFMITLTDNGEPAMEYVDRLLYSEDTRRIAEYVHAIDGLSSGQYMIRLTDIPDDGYPMSIYAQKLLKEEPDIDFFMEIKKQDENTIVSLRSVKEDANCVKIANANHGGGHIHAAGFTLK